MVQVSEPSTHRYLVVRYASHNFTVIHAYEKPFLERFNDTQHLQCGIIALAAQ